jgi:hypothetical protein
MPSVSPLFSIHACAHKHIPMVLVLLAKNRLLALVPASPGFTLVSGSCWHPSWPHTAQLTPFLQAGCATLEGHSQLDPVL